LIAKLVELERKLESVAASLKGARTDAIETQFRDTRKFVEVRLKDLGKLLNAEPRLARAAIANHVQKIEMTPDGKTYVASGSWDLLGSGSGAVSMVPGARIAPRVHYAFSLPPDVNEYRTARAGRVYRQMLNSFVLP
jgi:hypothetical protein